MKKFATNFAVSALVLAILAYYLSSNRLCVLSHDKFATIWCYGREGYDTRILFNGKGSWSMLTYRKKKAFDYEGTYTISGDQLTGMIGDKVVFRATLSSCEQLHIHSVDSRFLYLDDGNFLSPCHGK